MPSDAAFKKKILGIVINRVGDYEYELLPEEIENLVEQPIISIIPEDPILQESIAHRTPIVNFEPESASATALRELAQDLTGATIKAPEKALRLRPERATGAARAELEREAEKRKKNIIKAVKNLLTEDIAGVIGKIKTHPSAAKKEKTTMKKEEALAAISTAAPEKKAAKITKPAAKPEPKKEEKKEKHGMFGFLKSKPETEEEKKKEKTKKRAVEKVSETAAKPPEEEKEKKHGLKDRFVEFLHTDYDLTTMKAKEKEPEK